MTITIIMLRKTIVVLLVILITTITIKILIIIIIVIIVTIITIVIISNVMAAWIRPLSLWTDSLPASFAPSTCSCGCTALSPGACTALYCYVPVIGLSPALRAHSGHAMVTPPDTNPSTKRITACLTALLRLLFQDDIELLSHLHELQRK